MRCVDFALNSRTTSPSEGNLRECIDLTSFGDAGAMNRATTLTSAPLTGLGEVIAGSFVDARFIAPVEVLTGFGEVIAVSSVAARFIAPVEDRSCPSCATRLVILGFAPRKMMP